jgi:PAS domain S-box-containing protein
VRATPTKPPARPERAFTRSSALLGLAAGGVSLATLLAWGLGVPWLGGLLLARGSPRPAVAGVTLLVAIALAALHRLPRSRVAGSIATAASAAALAIGVATLGQALGFVGGAEVPHALRLAVPTALGMILVGVGLLLAARRPFNSLGAQLAAGAALTLALLVMLGYAYSVRDLYQVPGSRASAPWSAVTWGILALGILVARPEYALSRVLAGRSLGADQLRRSLPLMLAVPIAAGLAAVGGMRARWYGEGMAFAVFTLLAISALALVGAASARRIDQLARERARIEGLFRRTFENAAVGVALLDGEGRWSHVNDRLCEIVGWSREDLLGRGFQVLAHPEDLAIDLGVVRAFQRGDYDSRHLERAYRSKSGEPVWVDLFVSSVRAKDGRVTLFIVVLQDVSARRMAERAKDEFFALVSHELRSPLNVLTSWLSVLRRNPAPELRDRALDIAERSTHLLTRLIGDLLDASRIASGKLEIERDVFDVVDVVRAAGLSLEPVARGRGVTLAMDLADRPLFVEGDPERLDQVARNLLENAIKFTPPGGRIELRVDDPGDGAARLTVHDSGEGIPAEVLPHVFERFAQGEGGPRGIARGLGLGLAIVRHLVELHGGSVDVSSPGPGRGSTFRVTVPTTTARPRRSGTGREEEPGDALEGVPVLILDPDRAAAEGLALTLEDADAAVAWARSGEEALEAARVRRPRVLVAEVDRLGDAAAEVLRTLRKDDEGDRVAAVALTTSRVLPERRRAREAGFDVVLGRPVDPQRILGWIHSLLRGARRVLVVDDDSDAADSLALLLARRGFEVERAYDAASALSAASSFHPQIVLTDVHLGGLDGTALARTLRQPRDVGSEPIQVVAVTGRRREELGVDAALFDAVVRKPVDLDELVGVLDAKV